MKINANCPHQNSSKPFYSFVLFGPLIATILTILYGHLIGFISTNHFGQNIHFRNIIAMIISFIPITIGAYIIGFIPSWITDRTFYDLINSKIFLNINSTTRFVLIGVLVGAIWAIILGTVIAVIIKTHIWWCFLAVGAVTVPASIVCALIENRMISSSIKQ